jgi:DNA ligase-1
VKAFAELYRCLDETTKTSVKLACLRNYFSSATASDAAWAVYFLSGRKPRQVIKTRDLRAWAAAAADVPDWLFDESYDAVGDLAETIALILPEPERSTDAPLAEWVEQRLLPLRTLPPEEQRERLVAAWRELDRTQRLVFNKLLTGAFRIGVAQTLLTRALAETAGVPAAAVAHRLMGAWEPTAEFFAGLLTTETSDADVSRPYPFALAHPLSGEPLALGDPSEWLAEWKWDGIRAQCIHRQGQIALWSRGEELMTERFPELLPDIELLPAGTVLDGEIVAWRDGVLPFSVLQKRIGRKTLGKKILVDAPAAFIAFDVLEHDGLDVRTAPLRERRASLYTDYTFALWNEGELTPFAKAYSGLTDEEIREVDRFVRDNTIEKFGPVRRVKPELVFELGFEDIRLSTRHKAGVAVRFPRMLRWRTDKRADQADSLDTVKELLKATPPDAPDVGG